MPFTQDELDELQAESEGMTTPSVNPNPLITAALVDAAAAHHEYEKTLGHRDDDWASWYARFLVEHGVTIHV